MATLQERLQMKRIPIDKWSVKEQLCLASAVSRSGDQNWVSVSRALKPFAEANRPPDWFSQKNCAAQYGLLLENVETPKRKKRMSGGLESGNNIETPQEVILKKLTEARKTELKKKIEDEKREYLKLQEEMELLRSGAATDEVIEKWSKEIEEEEVQKSQDAVTHSQWLKQREERKLEVERVFRPVKSSPGAPNTPQGQKRKASESSIEPVTPAEVDETILSTPPEPFKPAMSPLLTSLLKTPSHVPNPVTSSILHSAITNTQQRGSSPTIASLLSTSTAVPVSPSLQQLVSTAIAQEPEEKLPKLEPITSIITPTVSQNIKIEITEENQNEKELITVEVSEIKSEEKTEVEKSSCSSLTPEQEDFPIEIEQQDDIPKKEIEPLASPEKILEEATSPPKTKEVVVEKPVKVENKLLDVYDFDTSSQTSNDTEIEPPISTKEIPETTSEISTDSSASSNSNNANNDEARNVQEELNPQVVLTPIVVAEVPEEEEGGERKEEEGKEEEKVAAAEDEDSDKEMNKKVSEIQKEIREQEVCKNDDATYVNNIPAVKKTTLYDEYDFEEVKKPEQVVDTPQELSENIYDDLVIEVTKLDKSGKAKRDYSRMRKKDEKEGLDILLAVEKAVGSLETLDGEDGEGLEETGSEKDSQDSEEKKLKLVAKDTDRSNSPWTEEEAEILPKNRRRLSTTTPNDSVPNSPASGIVDDDRDYRTWKKSVMLVYNRLVTHKCASLFLKPITDEQAPGYHEMVYRAMDLQTIRKHIESGAIRSTAEFQRDVLLMFNNAIMYNSKNEMVYQMAQQMQLEGLQQIQILMQAQAQVELPVRRETRTSESGLKRKRGQEEPLPKSKKRRDE